MRKRLGEIGADCKPKATKGIKALWLIEAEDVFRIPRAVEGMISQDLTISPGGSFKSISFLRGEASFDESSDADSKHGDYFKQNLQFTILGDSRKIIAFRKLLGNNRYTTIYQDFLGNIKLVPALKPQTKQSTGGDRNTNIFELSAKSPQPSYIYSGSLTPVSFPDFDSEDFDNEDFDVA